MRGIMGLGTNMMNVYTVRRATQGLAEYILSLGRKQAERGVVISYDTRLNSDVFARAAANVLSFNGIKVYLFSDVHPVPMLSFAVRELNAVAGIMITASHNPKEYNGYKVYGEDGAQMSPENTAKVVRYMEGIDLLCRQRRPGAGQGCRKPRGSRCTPRPSASSGVLWTESITRRSENSRCPAQR